MLQLELSLSTDLSISIYGIVSISLSLEGPDTPEFSFEWTVVFLMNKQFVALAGKNLPLKQVLWQGAESIFQLLKQVNDTRKQIQK